MSDTPQQGATSASRAATLARYKEIVADLNDSSPECFAALDAIRIMDLETELAAAQRLLAEERLHTEDLKAHQAEELRQIRAEVERLKERFYNIAKSIGAHNPEECVLEDEIDRVLGQLAAKEQELITSKTPTTPPPQPPASSA